MIFICVLKTKTIKVLRTMRCFSFNLFFLIKIANEVAKRTLNTLLRYYFFYPRNSFFKKIILINITGIYKFKKILRAAQNLQYIVYSHHFYRHQKVRATSEGLLLFDLQKNIEMDICVT